jgi:hypothetical protein
MKNKIAIIGNQTIGTPTEIYDALHGKATVLIVSNELADKTFTIENTIIEMPKRFTPPLTRKERRKLKRTNNQ